MEPAVDRVLEAIRSQGHLSRDRPLIAMVSGGRDSVCLLHAAVAFAGAGAVSVLHVNYGLRDAAAGDQRHCEELCAQLGVSLEVRAPERPREGNLQAWARDARYGAAVKLALARSADVAVGHTADDQAETILYRLASSPGRRALLGMAPRDGRLVRPLLGVSREETGAYCRAAGLRWRDDESNESDVFARARVREDLLPALAAIHPAARDNVIRTAEVLREEADVLDGLVDEVLDGRWDIEVDRLGALPPALARLVVRRLAEEAVGGLVPRAAHRTQDVLALGRSGSLDLGDGARASVSEGILSMIRTPPPPVRGAA